MEYFKIRYENLPLCFELPPLAGAAQEMPCRAAFSQNTHCSW